jgi:radical SAM-linked protein
MLKKRQQRRIAGRLARPAARIAFAKGASGLSAMRNKYRLCFEKTGALCFLGHLDLLKVFQRAVKRSGLPISYSNGFNPHQQMSFALPLPLGMAGHGEYMDIEFDVKLPAEEIITRLNEVLPEGLYILSARALCEGEKSAAALVTKAVYDIALNDSAIAGRLDEIIADLLASQEVIISRKTKGGIKTADIRKDIFELKNQTVDGNPMLFMVLSAGSMNNLKADAVVDTIYQKAEAAYDPFAVGYVRRKLLISEEFL